MSAGRSASFCLIVCLLLCSSEAEEQMRAEPGQNVTLKCKVPNNDNIIIVEWKRPGLKPEYALFYRSGHFDPHNQHPSYVNRVDLQDREMKNGDVSLILKDVKMNDTGRYECRVFQRETNRTKRSILNSDPINTIYLDVGPSGHKDGGGKDGGDKVGGDKDGRANTGIIAVGLILLLAVLASVGFLVYRRHKRQNSNLPVPPDEAADEQIL